MMPRRPLAAALSFALALTACSKKTDEAGGSSLPSGPVAPVPPPAGKSWVEVTSMTPEGGVRIGNPNAAVKFVEYASLTCPHCRDFTKEAAEPLQQKYIATGKVSWEYRPFILNSLDVAAFLLARCRGAEPFFKLAEQTYGAQETWVGQYMQLTPDQQAQLQATDPSQLFKKIAAASGLDAFFRARGLSSAQQDKCLGDTAAAQALADNTNKATNEQAVTGTPTFFINGTKAEDLHLWTDVDKRLGQLTGS